MPETDANHINDEFVVSSAFATSNQWFTHMLSHDADRYVEATFAVTTPAKYLLGTLGYSTTSSIDFWGANFFTNGTMTSSIGFLAYYDHVLSSEEFSILHTSWSQIYG
jgi:hypothetical protein